MNWDQRFMDSIPRAPEGEGAGGGGGGGAAGSGAAGAAAAGTGAGAAGGGGAAPVFADTLPEHLKTNAAFKDFKDVGSLAESFLATQKMVGLDKNQLLRLPTAPEDAEGWNGVYKALGRPDAADGYQFGALTGMPEGLNLDDARRTAFAAEAHKLGLSQAQLAGLYAWDAKWMGDAFSKSGADRTAADETAKAALKTEWGPAYDERLGIAEQALNHYGPDGKLAAELKAAGLHMNPELVKVLYSIGKGLQEDGAIGRGGSGAGQGMSSPTEAKQQIAALKGDQTFLDSYLDKGHPGHAAAVEKMKILNEQAYPPEAKG